MTMRFSFGKNWETFLAQHYSEARLKIAINSLQEFLGLNSLQGLSFTDIGCGSGLFSLAAFKLGAKSVISFDIDPLSIKCCQYLKAKAGNPPQWQVRQGSVLDRAFTRSLPKSDVVLSWGVLHHTGSMWSSIESASLLVKPGGYFYIAIYNKIGGVLGSRTWTVVKRLYNASPQSMRHLLEACWMSADIIYTLFQGKNPIKKIRQYKINRGMSWYTDIEDWLGGYPYEYATAKEMVDFCKNSLDLISLKVVERNSLACNEFLLKKPG